MGGVAKEQSCKGAEQEERAKGERPCMIPSPSLGRVGWGCHLDIGYFIADVMPGRQPSGSRSGSEGCFPPPPALPVHGEGAINLL